MDADEKGLEYLNRIRAADGVGARLAIVSEINRDDAIGENELTSLVAILGQGRYEARGTRPNLLAKLRDAVTRWPAMDAGGAATDGHAAQG